MLLFVAELLVPLLANKLERLTGRCRLFFSALRNYVHLTVGT